MSFSKRSIGILTIPLVTLLLGFLMVKPANATKFVMTDYTLAQDETISEDLYITNSTTEINGFVQGDLFIGASSAKVTGTVTGDLFLFGSDVTFSGNTFGNIYAFGNNVSIQGVVKGSVFTSGTVVNINGDIEKDLNLVSMKATLDGTISDDARIAIAEGNIQSVIQGDLLISGSQYTLQEENITGDIYTASVVENIAEEQGVNLSNSDTKAQSSVFENKLFNALFAFCSMSLVGYVLIAMAPIKTGKIMTKVIGSKKDLLLSFAIGLGILIVAPFLILILSISVVGAPLALFVSGILLFLTIFGKLWVETAFGQEVLTLFKVKDYRPFKSLAIGRFLTVCIGLIPVFGWIYSCVLSIIAMGAFARMKFEYFKGGKKKK